jgi:hypothetical protein
VLDAEGFINKRIVLKMDERKLCIYCGNWFPVLGMRQLPKKEYGNYYCEKHYPDVLADYWKLPWNRRKYD